MRGAMAATAATSTVVLASSRVRPLTACLDLCGAYNNYDCPSNRLFCHCNAPFDGSGSCVPNQ